MGVSHSQRSDPRHMSAHSRRAKTSMDSRMRTSSLNKNSLQSMGSIKYRQGWSTHLPHNPDHDQYHLNGQNTKTKQHNKKINGHSIHQYQPEQNQYDKNTIRKRKIKSVKFEDSQPSGQQHQINKNTDKHENVEKISNIDPQLKYQQQQSKLIQSSPILVGNHRQDLDKPLSVDKIYLQMSKGEDQQYGIPSYLEGKKVIHIYPAIKRSTYEKLKWNINDHKKERREFLTDKKIIEKSQKQKLQKSPSNKFTHQNQYRSLHQNGNFKVKNISSIHKKEAASTTKQLNENSNTNMNMIQQKKYNRISSEQQLISQRRQKYQSNESYYLNGINFDKKSSKVFDELEKINKGGKEIRINGWNDEYQLQEEEQMVKKRSKNGRQVISQKYEARKKTVTHHK